MNLARVEKVAQAVLYEGYILYPYRASTVKNRQRFNFGGVYPPEYSQAQAGTDPCQMQTECLIEASGPATIEIRVRFLHLRSRDIGHLNGPWREGASDAELDCQWVESLQIDGQSFHTWQEAVEREVIVPNLNLFELTLHSHRLPFCFSANQETEPLRDTRGQVVAVARRCQPALFGAVEINAQLVRPGLYKFHVAINNQTRLENAATASRDDALLRALVSTHTILGVSAGEFVSLLDPPDALRAAVASCVNQGAWPILVGDEGERDTLLASPIILYDYPQLAPESAGELFDGTEIDEILTLRIMTLTDDEKREMRNLDDRTRAILERTEMMPPDQLMKMHGAMRSLHPAERSAP